MSQTSEYQSDRSFEKKANIKQSLLGDQSAIQNHQLSQNLYDSNLTEINNNQQASKYVAPAISNAQIEMNQILANFMLKLQDKYQADQSNTLRDRKTQIYTDSIISEGELESEKTNKQSLISYIQAEKAPYDALYDGKSLYQIKSLKKYVQSINAQNKNPKTAFFDQSMRHYTHKFNSEENQKKNITVKSFLITEDYQNYVKDLSMEIILTNQGCLPIVKTFEWNAYNKTRFYKALKFYDYRGDCSLKKQIIVDEGLMDQNYRSYDTSLLHFGNTILFYKREENWHKLQQYDLVTSEQVQLDGYQIEEPRGSDIRYHIIFSKEFGQSRQQLTNKSSQKLNVHKFLSKQYILCQAFRVKDDMSYTVMPIVLMCMKDISEIILPIAGKTRVLKEAIQFVGHIYEEEQENLKFIAIDPFSTHQFYLDAQMNKHSDFIDFDGNNEIQLHMINDLLDEQKSSEWKHENLTPFYKHQNPQFIIQSEIIQSREGQNITQYFYIANDNQFQLIYPNYKDTEEKNWVIFQIAKIMTYNYAPEEEDYLYEDDFMRRQKDLREVTYKKISHVCSEQYKNKNHFKKSEHLKRILDYSRDLNIHDKIILSTDQERSMIYIYQSNQITGYNKIEIYNFENYVEYSSKIRSLHLQVQEIIGDEEANYGTHLGTKLRQCSNNTYYINSKYRKIISSKTHIKTRFHCNGQYLTYRLNKREKESFIVIEHNNGKYVNLQIKQNFIQQKIQMEIYCRSSKYYTFIFSITHDCDKEDSKLSYFIIRKSLNEIEKLVDQPNLSIINMQDEVVMLLENDLKDDSAKQMLARYTEKMTFQDMLTQQKNQPIQKINLTFELILDSAQILEFIPMIYQDKKIAGSHCFMIFDIEKLQFVSRTNINSDINIKKFLRTNESGYAIHTLTRTSDIFLQSQKLFSKHFNSNDSLSQIVKYQISSQFYLQNDQLKVSNRSQQQISFKSFQQIQQAQNSQANLNVYNDLNQDPAKSTIELNEYLVKYCQRNSINLIGRKQMILPEALSIKRKLSFQQLLFIPYFDRKGRIKGSSFILQEDEGAVIDLLDQDQNNLYHEQTETLQFGHQRFLTSLNNHEEYIMVVSSQLKQYIYLSGNLENNETNYILNKIQKKLASMQLSKFEYFVLNDDFDYLMKKKFYQPQEVLEGRTICDLCVTFPREIQIALQQQESVYKSIEGSLIDEICNGDPLKLEYYIKAGICEENLIIQSDCNFVTTLRLAMELNQNQTVKYLLNKVYEIDSKKYQEQFMLDLPVFLRQHRIERIYPFFSKNKKNQQLNQMQLNDKMLESCIFEKFIQDPDLPKFSSEQEQYYVKESFKDFHNSQNEVIQDVKEIDLQILIGKAREIEIEHSLIDFQKIIIGEKIRGYQEVQLFQNINFNDQHFAKLLYVKPDHQISFYTLESVNKLVDFQFVKTKQFMRLIFRFYALGFAVPFCLSLMTENLLFLNMLFTICFVGQFFFFLFELIQLKEQKANYFQDFRNYIEISQFFMFLILYYKKMVSQFQSETLFEIILQVILLSQSIYKCLFFIRVYKNFCFVTVIVYSCAYHLLPIAAIGFSALIAFTMVQQLLHSGINDPNGEMNLLKYDFLKRFIQTFKNSQGQYIVPIIDQNMISRMKGDMFSESVIYMFLVLIWIAQVIFFMMFTAVFITKVIEVYIKCSNNFAVINQKIKAHLNYECYQIMDLFIKQRKFKMILISRDTNMQAQEDQTWLGAAIESMKCYLLRNGLINIVWNLGQKKLEQNYLKKHQEFQNKQNQIKEALLQENQKLEEKINNLNKQFGLKKHN